MGETAAAVEIRQPFRDARGAGAIVFDPARLRQAAPEMLDPGFWRGSASPVQEGGRGAAWFVRGEFGDAVLRHYRRGGLAARLGRSGYFWLGESRVRCLAEFRLLAGLRAERLPVPVPLLAGYWRRGLHYGAAILVERIPGARALAAWLDTDADAAPWEAVGAMLADFHRAGLDHADLNAHNILVDGDGRPWLIDFDRSRRRAAGAWRQSNLERLARSLAKLCGGADRWRPGFARLQGAYEHAMAGAPA
jgi:3-deoxy-D-manno-octulosonic acid kinase